MTDYKEKTLTTVKIIANPFLQDTKVIIDEQPLDFECTHGRNTQGWVDEIFYKIYDRTNGLDQLALVFHGLEIDYEDVVDAAKAAANHLKFDLVTTEFILARTAEERLSEMKAVIADISHNTSIKEFQSEGFQADFERILAPDFSVHVLATMSAGKSTLINAMMGKDILPAKNQACTATMTAVYDCKQTGENFTGKAWDGERNLIYTCDQLTQQDVEEWNQDTRVTDIAIRGDLNGAKTSQHVSLILVDTPGPNNSQNIEHRRTTFKNIETSDMSLVLYVMNATQLGVDDDKHLLSRICEAINEGGKAARDRFLFVLNKIDVLNPEKEPVEHVLESAKKYLANIGIKDAHVFPIAAETTKLARMAKAGQELSRHERGHLTKECENIPYDLQSRIFDCISVSPSVRRTLEKSWEDALASKDLHAQAEFFGGIPVIEAVIAEHMEKYAHVHKVADACAMLKERYDDAYQKEVGDLENIIGSSEEELKDLNKNIEQLQSIVQGANFKDAVLREINKKKDIPENIEKEIRKSREDVQTFINGLEMKMQGTVDPTSAKKILARARDDLTSFAAGVCNFLEAQFYSIQESKIAEYKKIYNDHLSQIISSVDGNHPALNEIKQSLSIDRSTLSLDVSKVEKYTKTIIEEKGNKDKAWYKPWTWGDDEYSISEKKTVNLKEIQEKEMRPVRKWFDGTIMSAQSEVTNLSLRMKNLFIRELIPKAEAAMYEYLLHLQESTKSKSSVEAKMNEAQKIKKYLENIKARINFITSL